MDLTGMRFGRLTAIAPEPRRYPGQQIRWMCRCDCGETKIALRGDLRTGYTKSCGCLRKEVNITAHTKHGMYGTPEYRAWVAMIQRCEDSNVPMWKTYGGRGISVCRRWRESFANFYADMGDRPTDSHSLDRLDNNGNYGPDNCDWATAKEQANNRRPCQRISSMPELRNTEE